MSIINLLNGMSPSGAAEIEDVFSADAYTGTGAAQDIENGVNLVDFDGFVLGKARDNVANWKLTSTLRGTDSQLSTNTSNAELTATTQVTAFNANGFSVGSGTEMNGSGYDMMSWTFRQAPRFVDVVRYTGDGTAGREIAHRLETVPGCIIVKSITASRSWRVYHRGLDATAPEDYKVDLNLTNARAASSITWNQTAPTDTVFTLGDEAEVNNNLEEYEAYVFAHDPLGPSGDGSDGLIACGSYTGNGSTTGPVIDLGWEPQWLLTKAADQGVNWLCFDEMRGFADDRVLYPNLSNAESSFAGFEVTSKGFKVASADANINNSGSTYIYIAIRRGPMGLPTSGSQVCALNQGDSGGPPEYTSGWPVDFALRRDVTTTQNMFCSARLIQGTYLQTNLTNASATSSAYAFDFMDGWFDSTDSVFSWMLRRWPMCTDVVVYEGTGSAKTEKHNLLVPPEMMWVKDLDTVKNWFCYSAGIPDGYLYLNEISAKVTTDAANVFGNGSSVVAPTSTEIYVGSNSGVNRSTGTFIAILFATLPGISKVGSFSHTNGVDTDVDCGFTAGARMVIWKRTDSTGGWYLVDTERGYGKYILLNSTAAEVTATTLNTLASGFQVDSTFTTGDYVFLSFA